MYTDVYWIARVVPGRLGTMPRPRGHDWLEDELRALKRRGVDRLITALTDDEMFELKLTKQADLCQQVGVDLVRCPIVDRHTPVRLESFHAVVRGAAHVVQGGASVVTHCRMGIGRASLLAVGVLLNLGLEVDDAWARVQAARGLKVPDTEVQREWSRQYAAWLASKDRLGAKTTVTQRQTRR